MELQGRAMDVCVCSEHLTTTNIEPHLEQSGKKKIGGNCRGRAAKHVAALGIYSSEQTEAALIRESQYACFSV